MNFAKTKTFLAVGEPDFPCPSIIPLSRTNSVSKVASAATFCRRGSRMISSAEWSCSGLRIIRLIFPLMVSGYWTTRAISEMSPERKAAFRIRKL